MSEKKRINEIAKETGLANKDLIAAAQSLGFSVSSHSSSISDAEASKIVSAVKSGNFTQSPAAKEADKKPVSADKPLTFQGKAVVMDDILLERQRAREAEKKAAQKLDVPKIAIKVVEKAADKKAVSAAPVQTPKAEKKASPAPKQKVEVKADKPTEKPAVKKEVKEAHKEPKKEAKKVVAHEAPKETPKKVSKFDILPKVQIKVVKKAEFKEAPKPRSGGNRNNGQANRGGRPQGNRPQGQNQAAGAPGNQANRPAQKGVQKRTFNDTAALPANDRRRKNANGNGKSNNTSRGNDSRFNDGSRPGGPLRVNDNRNQVRNARNANWAGGRRGRKQNTAGEAERKFVALPESFEYTEGMTIADIAKFLHRESAEFIKKLFMMGIMATQNTSLDDETIELLLMEFNITPLKKVVEDHSDIERLFVEEDYISEESLTTRPPVVTIMGHVDHGKTTLLDHLRKNAVNIAEGEAGGITQHIGAYQLETSEGRKITFLDTPGHEAFTSMRARGASVTDITILVVAADDGVMPQTIEAISHSKAAGVPIIVAINKIDKEGANPQRVIQELAEHEVMPTEWGGDSEFVEISAKFDKNIDGLLETILLVADMQELKADPTVRAIGTVIEARLDKGKGAIATLLVQQGTLHQQDPIVAGNTFGRVRAMTNELGKRLKEAGPSTAVEITGLNDAPQAGDRFAVFEDEKSARNVGEERFKRAQLVHRESTRRVSLENLFDTIKEGQLKTIPIIIKADVQGTAEALASSLQKIEVEGVRVDIVHSAAGAINESDVALATASNAIIVGFNVRPTSQARAEADREAVDIRLHSIIYKVIEEVEEAMKGMLDPEFEEKVVGEALVQEIFVVSKIGTIAGFMVTSGKALRDAKVRVIRESTVLADADIASLKHLRDDVKEVGNAQEGGLMVDGFNDIEVGDTLEIYQMVEIKR
ncbi:MAG: translation initiation factor IF-2 [Streptococcaceae bacterium]|jgi:translation initiation factor IF-2|nr:translation initiation factor IF-2 [Streptococcaceae bacterium]